MITLSSISPDIAQGMYFLTLVGIFISAILLSAVIAIGMGWFITQFLIEWDKLLEWYQERKDRK